MIEMTEAVHRFLTQRGRRDVRIYPDCLDGC